MSSDIHCAFCGEAATGLLDEPLLRAFGAPSAARRVWENGLAFIVPSLGPLTPDHCLLVSRDHYGNLRETPANLRGEMLAIARMAAARLERASGRPSIIFENGAGRESGPRDCVQHIHIHLLTLERPVLNKSLLSARTHGEEVSRATPAEVWARLEIGQQETYAYWEANKAQAEAVRSVQLPRQLLRRTIADALGGGSWNWRDDPKLPVVMQMLSSLQSLFANFPARSS